MSIAIGVQRLLTDRVPAVSLGLVQVRYTRRRVAPPPWVPPRHHPVRAQLYKDDRKFVEGMLGADVSWQSGRRIPAWVLEDEQFHLIPGVPNPPDCTGNPYIAGQTKRIGLIGRKIGMAPQWLKNGKRQLCTLIHIPENHVLSANDPETWYRHSIAGKQKAFKCMVPKHRVAPMWSQMVGAQNYDSVFLTDVYRRIFARAGVPCKEYMAGFMVTEDAVVKPGTRLDARHFKVGQFLTVTGRTIDWGFQGVMHRWGMKGQMNKPCGPTKAHRRVGSIAAKGEAKVWPGRRLPGHMGWEWRQMPGMQILRINPLKQVIWIRGAVPGDQGEWLLLKDSLVEDKVVQDPPFPTFYAPENEFAELEERDSIHMITSQDQYVPEMHVMSHPSVVYTEKDETVSTKRDKSKAKTALKIKK